MITEKTKTTLQCTCEKPKCGKSWESQGEDIPERCRWCGSHTWNGQDLRNSKIFLSAKGITQSISDWSKQTGISSQTIRARIRLGWKENDIVSLPVGQVKGKPREPFDDDKLPPS